MHSSILPRLACPECQGALKLSRVGSTPPTSDALTWNGAIFCQSCHEEYPVQNGVPVLFRPSRKAQLLAFAKSYEALRLREGWAVEDNPSYYKELPFRDVSGRHNEEWAVRGHSFGRLVRRVTRFANGRSLRIVDLGAGFAWLAARLSESGHKTIAIDLDGGPNGLLAGRNLRNDSPEFACVQGELLFPPLAKEQADVIVLNASLHYTAEHEKIFASLYRALAVGGALVVLDSPTYRTPKERDLAQEASAQYYKQQETPELAYVYRGLVREELLASLSNFTEIECEVMNTASTWRSLAGRIRNGYQPAQFELVWARKAGSSSQ
jgi:SAM-dependent methyltransferase